MGIGVALFLLAVGAILTWAVEIETEGIDLDMIGIILMIIGVIGLLLSLLFLSSGPFGSRRERVVEREDRI